jgi:hypothetical protein
LPINQLSLVHELDREILFDDAVLPPPGRPFTPSQKVARPITIMLKQSHTSMKSPIVCPGNSRAKSAIVQAKFGICQKFPGYL